MVCLPGWVSAQHREVHAQPQPTPSIVPAQRGFLLLPQHVHADRHLTKVVVTSSVRRAYPQAPCWQVLIFAE